MAGNLTGKTALVAGATRGAGRGVAIELGAAGATVYATGRSSRQAPGDRPETIEETAELVTAAGGNGIPVRCDHTDPAQVRDLARRIGELDILVVDVPAGDAWIDWKPLWEHDLDRGLTAVHRGLDSHLITLHEMLPLLIKRGPGGLVVVITDGDDMFNARYRGTMFFDLIKVAQSRLGKMLAVELTPHRITSVSLTPGYLRSEAMLVGRGVTEATWPDAVAADPSFGISETPRYTGRAVAALAADPNVSRWTGRALSSGALACEYGFTDLDGSQPDTSRYFAEVVFGGGPGKAEDYR